MEAMLNPTISSKPAQVTSSNDVVYSVFYLTGGSTNFVPWKIQGIFNWECAKEKVASIHRQGYKAMAVKNGHIIGGYCSHNDFDTVEAAVNYYRSL